ncbi:MAG TPA: BREX system ATP-binding domain-containing protein, partial [Thermomicrobiaceae bacterium]|nr:BREX system ATP-binding domain-containing protein [Thermomicrobiaceae bacterium]
MGEATSEPGPIAAARHSAQPLLVGREREQELLRQQVERMLSGQGRLVLVSGEAGIGKSALVAAVADTARQQGAVVLTGGCYDLAITPPYGPWLDALGGYRPHDTLPNLPSWLRDLASVTGTTSQEFFEQVRLWLTEIANQQPLVLVLEDLHWADGASLDLLRFVARRLDDLALLLVATWRDDEGTQPISPILPALIREAQPLRIVLRRLNRAETRVLVAQRYRLANDERDALGDWVQRHAEGNPFFASEVLLALEHDGALSADGDTWRFNPPHEFSVPPLVRQVIEQRLGCLSEPTQQLLEHAAIIGQEPSLAFLQAVADVSDEVLATALDESIAAQMLTAAALSEGTLRFRHALVRETLYQRQNAFRRRARHRRVATLLLNAPSPSPVSLARHFQAAGDPQAVTWLARAGERSLAVYAPHDAITSLTRAEELAQRFGTVLPPSAVRSRGRAWEMVGDFARARDDYERTLRLAQEQGDRRAEWQALLDLGTLWVERDYDRAGHLFQQALTLARQELDDRAVAHSLNAVGNWHLNHEDPLPALGYHQEALALFTQRDDRPGVAATLDLLALAQYVAGDVRGAALQYARAVERLEDVDDRRLLSSALANWATAGGYFETDAVAAAEGPLQHWLAISARARAVAREIGWAAGQAYAEIQAGAMLGPRGDMGQALALAGAGMALAERIGHRQWMICGHVALGRMHADVFDPGPARAHLEAALTLSRTIASSLWTAFSAAALATMLVDLGELEAAGAVLDLAHDTERPALTTTQRRCRLTWARLLLARDQPERALEVSARLIDSAPNGNGPRSLPWLALTRGQALAALGHHGEAEIDLRAARLGARDLGYRHLLWRTDLALVQLWRDSRRASEVGWALDEAEAVIEEIAATLPSEVQRVAFLT